MPIPRPVSIDASGHESRYEFRQVAREVTISQLEPVIRHRYRPGITSKIHDSPVEPSVGTLARLMTLDQSTTVGNRPRTPVVSDRGDHIFHRLEIDTHSVHESGEHKPEPRTAGFRIRDHEAVRAAHSGVPRFNNETPCETDRSSARSQ